MPTAVCPVGSHFSIKDVMASTRANEIDKIICDSWGSWAESCAAGGGGEAEDDVDVVEVIAVGQVPV